MPGSVVAHDARAIADAVERLLADPAAAAEMGGRARVWAAHRFGWDEIAAAMIRAYGDALARFLDGASFSVQFPVSCRALRRGRLRYCHDAARTSFRQSW